MHPVDTSSEFYLLGAILVGLVGIAAGVWLVRFPDVADRILTTSFASPRVMGWFFMAVGVLAIVSGLFVEQP